MRTYSLVVRDDYCAVIKDGEPLWEANDPKDLIHKLLSDLVKEHASIVSLRQQLKESEEGRDKALRIIKEYYVPGVSRVTAFLKQLLVDDGNCCMLGRQHIIDIKKMLGAS